MSDDILLLRLLHVPVIVIKFISKTISIITYLPNYLIIFILDRIIFYPSLQSSLLRYIVFWPFRLLALNLVTMIFYIEFKTIYELLDLSQKEWYTQLFALLLGVGAMLGLMRKGYLQMIKKFNPTKLKSPMQHVRVYVQFFIDCVCIVLALFNILLITNAHKTLTYNYLTQQQLSQHHHQHIQHPFLHHITQLIHKALIFNTTFFYVNVFFKVFPWRYRGNIEFVLKEKDNLFNLLVLLTLLFLQTILDVFVVSLVGLVCLVHWKRELFKQRLRAQQRKYMVALEHFALIIVQVLQILFTVPCLTVNFTATRTHLTKLIQSSPSDVGQSLQFTPTKFFHQTLTHILCSLMKIPAYFSLAMIFLFRYKYKKYRQIVINELNGSAKPVSDWEVDKVYMRLFGEMVVDCFYLPFVVLATGFRPLNIKWLKHVINNKYDFERSMITRYFTKCTCDITCWLPLASILTLLQSTYSFRKIFTIAKGYYLIYKTQSLLQSITDQSLLKKYTLTLMKIILNDLPHIPLYLIMNLSLFQLFDKQLEPMGCYNVFQKVIKMVYIHRVKKSKRADVYFDMFSKDLASGLLQDEGHKMRFWKFAHKCERHIMLTKFLQLLVPKRRYQLKLQQIQKPHSLSQISNQYWYRYNITLKMIQICAYFTIQIIVSLIGVLVLAPLTLWRLPTFIIVYRVHNSKKYFFKVLFEVYKLMVLDLVYMVCHILGLLLAPVSYLRFRKKTMFKYGNVGYIELLKIERIKMRWIARFLIVQTVNMYMLVFAVCTIFVCFLRKHMYMIQLKRKHLSFSTLINKLFKGVDVPTFNELIDTKYKFVEVDFGEFEKITSEFFFQSMKDIPYLMMSLLIMLVMPWRIFYLKKALNAMKQSPSSRHQVTIVLNSVFKDYLCIILNTILLFSIVKTFKSLQLIRRNYHLNFFVGFLKYSYLKQLTYEMKQAIRIYFSLLLLSVCIVIDWQHLGELVMRVYSFYKQARQLQQTKKQNERMYTNTIKQNKDIKLFNRLGFFQYVTLCQFLTVKQLAHLARVSKMNYLLLQRQQIWIQKWQNNYSQKYQHTINGQTYKIKCIKAYQLDTHNNKQTQQIYTFNEIVKKLFLYHVYQTRTDLPSMIYPYLSQNIKQKYMKNYSWSIYQGYGPENELPQQQNQDEQFLRLTNQVRRQRMEIQPDYNLYFDYLFIRPIQFISQVIDRFYRMDEKRRFKQLIFIVMIIVTSLTWLHTIYALAYNILQLNRWIGVHIILTIYLITFNYLLIQRLQILYRFNWISLKPFNLYYDIKNSIITMINFIRIKFTLVKSWVKSKIYTPVKIKVINGVKYVIKLVKKIINYIASKARYVGKTIVDKVAAPLYIYCVNKLIAMKKIIIMFYKATKTAIEFIFHLINKLIITFYETVKIILCNLNNLYFNMLFYSRKELIRFGVIGEIIFTLLGLGLMTLPSIFCYLFYTERWWIIVSTIHSAVLIVLGYRHLNKIKLQLE